MTRLLRWFLILALMGGSGWPDSWPTLRSKAVKRYKVEWSDAQKGINGYHVDCFDEKDEWLGGLTFYLKDGSSGKSAALKDLDGVNLRSPIKPLSLGGKTVLKMVREFSFGAGQLHFWIQGKEEEWDVDLKADLKVS